MQQTERPTPFEVAPADPVARAARIRATLPGQVQMERLELAAAGYGPLYALDEIHRHVADTLSPRVGYRRGASLEPVESYRGRIPDDALIKYGDARESGLFSRFWVATPTYYKQPQSDPWIVAEVQGTDRWAVIAQWD